MLLSLNNENIFISTNSFDLVTIKFHRPKNYSKIT